MSNRTRHLLLASLALNVFVIGGAAGAAIMWQRSDIQGSSLAAARPDTLLRTDTLPPAYRLMLRQKVQEAARSLRPHYEEARAARVEVARSLVQSIVDQPALETALARGRAADFAIRTELEKAVVDTALTLPISEREALAEELRRVGTIRTPRPRPQSGDARP